MASSAPGRGGGQPIPRAGVAAAVVAVMVIVVAEPAAACYPRVFSFGDSLTDTGNFRFYYSNNSGEPALRPPYGETFFRRATGRFSNGRLVLDFIGINYIRPSSLGRSIKLSCDAPVTDLRFGVRLQRTRWGSRSCGRI